MRKVLFSVFFLFAMNGFAYTDSNTGLSTRQNVVSEEKDFIEMARTTMSCSFWGYTRTEGSCSQVAGSYGYTWSPYDGACHICWYN